MTEFLSGMVHNKNVWSNLTLQSG